jgi:hypothetical protein
MADQSGGAGPYLTKDQFYEWKDEFHLVELKRERQRQEDKKEILEAIEKSGISISEGCKDDSVRNEKRIEKLESQLQLGKVIGGIAAAIATLLGALGIYYK